MRIVALGLRGFPNIQGGVETHCEHLYPRLAAAGHEVIVLARKPYLPDPPPKTHRGVTMKALPCPRSRSLEAFAHTFIGVLYARLLNPDVLHIHAIGPSLFVPLARLLGMRVVSTNHGPDYARQKWTGAAKSVLRLGERLGTRFSNQVIAISQPIADHLRERFGRRAAIIPNGVVVRPPATGHATLERFGLTAGTYLLAVGRLVPEKGFHDLIDAFMRASRDCTLVIAGAADHEDAYSLALKTQAAAHPSIVMTGFMNGDALSELYTHARAFVLPSYHEGLPIVLLEAMSHGLPVIASDIPANRAVGLDARCYFAPGDRDTLASRLGEVLSADFDEASRREQIAFVARHFDWDDVAARTDEVFRAVVSRTGSLGSPTSPSRSTSNEPPTP